MTPYEESQVEFNFERFAKVLDYIKRHPEAHDQTTWAGQRNHGTECQTVACFAGWTCILNGERLAFQTSYNVGFRLQAYRLYADSTSIQQRAQELLGLTDKEREKLFSPYAEVHDFDEFLTNKFREDAEEANAQTQSIPVPTDEELDAFRSEQTRGSTGSDTLVEDTARMDRTVFDLQQVFERGQARQ